MAHNVNVGVSHNNLNTGQLILGVREDTNATSLVGSDGLYHPLLFDTAGNLRVGVQYQAGGGGTSVQVTTASNEITVNCTSSNSSIQVFGTVTATGISVSMGPVGVTGGNININSANNIISVTSTGLFGVITTSSNSSIQVFGTVTATGVSVSMGPVGVTGGNINIVSANNIISITSTGLFGVTTTSSNSSIQVFGTVTATGVSVTMGPVGVTGGNININSANNIISITSTGLLGVTQTGYWLISHSGYLITSSVNNAVTITTASAIQSITSTGLLGVTQAGYWIMSHTGYMIVSSVNNAVTITTASAIQSITSTGLLGVTQAGYWIVSHTGYMITSGVNPAVYSTTVTNRDGTFVNMPYTTESGYFSTSINVATSASNILVKHPQGLNIYLTHIKASCLTPTNYWLVEDATGTPITKWGPTYLGNYAGENATLTAPLKITAAKDIRLGACCTNFTLTVVGYVK
jgi:hypothetical protein